MSTIKKFDFSSLLRQEGGDNLDDELQDVEFIVLENGGKVGRIRGHKLVLSLVSEVFRRQFYGCWASGLHTDISKPAVTGLVLQVEIRDFSFENFQTMIRYIYTGDASLVTEIKDLDELFGLYRLADRYFLSELKGLAKDTAMRLPFSTRNYAAVFKTLGEHQDLLGFEDLCKELRKKCAMAVTQEWKTVDDCKKFWLADHQDATKRELFQQIAELKVMRNKDDRAAKTELFQEDFPFWAESFLVIQEYFDTH